MREFKFRAWNIEKKEYLYFTIDDMFIDRHQFLYHIQKFALEKRKNFIIEQFTGLQDKNGIDIYEGDKVKGFYTETYIDDNNLIYWDGIIIWSFDGWCIDCVGHTYQILCELNNLQVIGNVHEGIKE